MGTVLKKLPKTKHNTAVPFLEYSTILKTSMRLPEYLHLAKKLQKMIA